jgi:hypothetical protein
MLSKWMPSKEYGLIFLIMILRELWETSFKRIGTNKALE